jgi:predicted transcriptional regulator
MVEGQNLGDSNNNTFNKIEGMILEKLLTMANQQTPLISEEELRQSLAESSKSPQFESALDKLIRDGFVSRIGNDEFQITSNGIEEHSRRLNEGTLF